MKKSEAITLVGNQTKLAKLLGISSAAVCQWRHDQVPPARLFQLQVVRPDLFPPGVEKVDDEIVLTPV